MDVLDTLKLVARELCEFYTDKQSEGLRLLKKQIAEIEAERQKIEWTRINNDVNGNPRYVCHFLNLIKDGEFDNLGTTHPDGSVTTADSVIRMLHGMSMTDYKYHVAVKRANKLGGRKFHTKQYGGGIVFQSYNIQDDERRIKEFLAQL